MIGSATATCDRNTARCADARSYNHALRPCCRGHVVDITRNVTEAFVAAGVTFWADYGTLLGAVRNPMTTRADYPWLSWDEYPWLPQGGELPGGVIPHDKDADLGVLYEDWGKAQRALRTLAQHQYDIKAQPFRGSVKVRLSSRNHINLDLFFWHTRPNGKMFRRQYVASLDRFKGRDFQKDALFPLTSVEWEGLTLPAPRDREAFCAFRYGPTWLTPVAANNDGVVR